MPDRLGYSPDGSTVVRKGGKVALFGGTPGAQPDAIASVATTESTSTSPFGYSSTQANAIVSSLNAVIAALRTIDGIKV